jgi:uncharacterized LabA/DUF88 family protein
MNAGNLCPMTHLIPYTCDLAKAMIFVDGENLAIRYGNILKAGKAHAPRADTRYRENILVWSPFLNGEGHGTPAVMRKYYYTAVQGDQPALADVEKQLKEVGIESPRVFKKDKGKGSKRVDITLATDMLLHATRKHYDVAVLVAGDEDYIPLIKAVQGEGARVIVWFVPDGLSPALYQAADDYLDLEPLLFPRL